MKVALAVIVEVSVTAVEEVADEVEGFEAVVIAVVEEEEVFRKIAAVEAAVEAGAAVA